MALQPPYFNGGQGYAFSRGLARRVKEFIVQHPDAAYTVISEDGTMGYIMSLLQGKPITAIVYGPNQGPPGTFFWVLQLHLLGLMQWLTGIE